MNNQTNGHCESVFFQILKAIRFRQAEKITEEQFFSSVFSIFLQCERDCWSVVIDRLDQPTLVQLNEYISKNPSVSSEIFLPGSASESELAIKQVELASRMQDIKQILSKKCSTSVW
jgi:hypothetical protein